MKDQELFLNAMGDVKPLKQDNSRAITAHKKTNLQSAQARRRAAEANDQFDPNPLSTEEIDLVDAEDELSYKKDGVQQGVFKNLRLGKYEVHSALNLHGQSVNNARQTLYQFITDCHKSNLRSLLIQHGKGIKSEKALLKSYINKWLRQFDQVLAFHSAQSHQGGTGAVYVLLKKSDEARLNNKERHQKRGANQ